MIVDMPKRLQVLLDEEEYSEIQAAARSQRMSIAEWVRQALCKTLDDLQETVDAKLRAIIEASSHRFPTADIETMLRDIEAGRRLTARH